MANTLSGKLAQIDQDKIHTNSASLGALFRYIGIVDIVNKVADENIELTENYNWIKEGERILLGAQNVPEERCISQLESSILKKVEHTIEDGNLIIDISKSTDNQTAFWSFNSLDKHWHPMTLQDGTVSV